MSPYRLLEQLLAFEQRVRQVYVVLSQCQQFPAELREIWKALAEDETHHIVALERSAHLFSVMESPPTISDQALADVEELVRRAEAMVQQPSLSSDDAFHQVLTLEGSELNRIDSAWMHSFGPTASLLMESLTPATQPHIRRLVDAIHRFSTNPTLRQEADALLAQYDKPKHDLAATRSAS
jgi:hypothetical protein